MPKGWSMRSTASARASPSTPAQIARVFARGARARPAGEAPCRAAVEPRRRARLPHAFGALSADHLEYLDDGGRRGDGGGGHGRGDPAGRVLHAARDASCRPSRPSRARGVPMAVATDCNPGSSPMTSLLLAMNMACTLFRMTPEEAWQAPPRHAARALGLADRGVIAAGHARRPRGLGLSSHPAELSLSHRVQPALQAHLRRCLVMLLTPGATRLDHAGGDLARGARRPSRSPRRRPAIDAAAAIVAKAAGGGRGRSTASTPASGSSPRCGSPPEDTAHAAAQPDPVALLRRRRAARRRHDPADDGAEAALARPRRLGRALGDGDADRGDAGARRHPGDPGAGLGRRLRRPRAARPHDGGDDRRGRGESSRARCCPVRRRCAAPGSRPWRSARRRGSASSTARSSPPPARWRGSSTAGNAAQSALS